MTEQTPGHGETTSIAAEPEDAEEHGGLPAGRKLRVGLLGAGRQGRALATAIARVPDCELVAVCDVDEERAKSLADQYGARHYTLWQSMLIFLDMDAVFIATPAVMHAEHALTALQERRHVYLEKPPALSLGQARRIEEMAAEQERIVHVGLQHRYSDLVPPFYQALEGRNISVVHAHLYRGVLDSAEEWDDELVGGLFFGEAFHLLDLVRFLVDEVVAVGAFTGQALWRDVPEWRGRDSAAVAFQLAAGGCGTLTLTQAMSLSRWFPHALAFAPSPTHPLPKPRPTHPRTL
ncbi:MAG: Gfo/Idh/MocA family oxidoreductase, partial [Chloroflexi bacterium]|nr:Gfo/Idh/MocA family oxidoreductase [Chloroflexota bacterium]